MNKFFRVSISVCRGTLSYWWYKPETPDVYDEPPPSAHLATSSEKFVTYEHGGAEKRITSVDDLLGIIRDRGCSPRNEVESNPVELAVVFGFLLHLGENERVIEDGRFLEFLDEQFDVTMKAFAPRVEDDHFHFAALSCAPSEALAPIRYEHITAFVLDLTSGRVDRRIVNLRPRQLNEFFADVECPYCHAEKRISFRAPIGTVGHEPYEVGDLVVESLPLGDTAQAPTESSPECKCERRWRAGFGMCPTCSRQLAARIEIRHLRFHAVRPTLETLALFDSGPIEDVEERIPSISD